MLMKCIWRTTLVVAVFFAATASGSSVRAQYIWSGDFDPGRMPDKIRQSPTWHLVEGINRSNLQIWSQIQAVEILQRYGTAAYVHYIQVTPYIHPNMKRFLLNDLMKARTQWDLDRRAREQAIRLSQPAPPNRMMPGTQPFSAGSTPFGQIPGTMVEPGRIGHPGAAPTPWGY